jgi:hypothetical protein
VALASLIAIIGAIRVGALPGTVPSAVGTLLPSFLAGSHRKTGKIAQPVAVLIAPGVVVGDKRTTSGWSGLIVCRHRKDGRHRGQRE